MSTRMDPVTLALTRDLLESVAEEMAAVCMRTAVSPNIKERRDLSAAVFDGTGRMVAHAAHIPVHLGAMPMSVRAVLAHQDLGPGDVALVNDPYSGGTHLPDITAVAPVFADRERRPAFLVAVRAHHADVGGSTPGSMAPEADIHAEGTRIPPVLWQRGGEVQEDVVRLLLANMRDPDERRADLAAQAGALAWGARRLGEMGPAAGGLAVLSRRAGALLAYASRLVGHALEALPDGEGRAREQLGVSGIDGRPAVVAVHIQKRGRRLTVDFTGTTGPVGLGLNATRAVVWSAVYYFVRSLCPVDTPTNDGLLEGVKIEIPVGSLLDPGPPHPVAGGNVETSQRAVDVLWLAASRLWSDLMPAPGSGTMSNWTFGSVAGGAVFPAYYETVPGGAGGGPEGPGHAAIQLHMTNTRNTPVEVLESRWPVRVERLALRRGSGGRGRHRGGEGLVREIRFLEPATVACLMTRQKEPPPGAAGGQAGSPGRVTLISRGRRRQIAPQARFAVQAGDVLRVETPGGGGYGRA